MKENANEQNRGRRHRKGLSNAQFAILIVVMVLVGMAIMIYPWFSNWWNERHQSRAIMTYKENVDGLKDAQYEEMLSAARLYNENLASEALADHDTDQSQYPSLSDLERVPDNLAGGAGLNGSGTGAGASVSSDSASDGADQAQADPSETVVPSGDTDSDAKTGHFNWQLTDEDDAQYQSLLNESGNGMIGYIQIPKIDVNLPIYHGTSDAVLQTGIGHLEGSSLPVKGETVHAVLSGHRGLPSARLFTDLDQLTIGDTFSITVLNETDQYVVDKITMVDPTDFSDLGVTQGRDYVTLLTCTPYGINTERLLVRGHLVEPGEEETTVVDEDTLEAERAIAAEHRKPSYIIRTLLERYAPVSAVAVALIIFLLVVLIGGHKKRD